MWLGVQVKDSKGNFAAQNVFSAGNLNERVPPTFTATRTSTNDITIQFDEAVTATGGGALSASNFIIQLDGQSVDTASLSGGASNEYTLDLGLSSPASGGEVVTVDVSNVVDANGNAAASSEKTVTLLDKVAPTFTVSVQSGGTAAQVSFSEDVQAASGGGALDASMFVISISGGTATKGTPTVSGSGSVWTVDLDLQGTADGSEQLTLDVAASAIADAAGNVVTSNSQTMTLVDLPPTFSITVTSDNKVHVTFSEPVTNAAGAALAIGDFEVSLSGGAATSTNVVLSSTTTSVRVVMEDLLRRVLTHACVISAWPRSMC